MLQKAALVIGVLMIPLMYSYFYLNAFWDPYQRLDKVPVAVVNLDEGAVINDEERNLGDEITDKLKEEKELGFDFTTAEKAKEGVLKDQYYASITIPKDFSADAATVGEDTKKLHGKIIYSANQKKNYLAAQILENAMPKIKEEVNSKIDKQIVGTISAKVKDVPKQLGKLDEGLLKLDTGAMQLSDGTAKLAGGAGELSDGVSTLNGKVPTLKKGVSKLDKGAAELASGMKKLTGKSKDLKDGASQLADGASDLVKGLMEYTAGVSKANGGASELKKGVKFMSDVVKEKYSGTFVNGETISFSREWRGHRFTDDECEKLLKGQTLVVRDLVSKKNPDKTYAMQGKLTHQTYKGHEFWGFEGEFLNEFPESLLGHKFTEDEQILLEGGKEVYIEGMEGKRGPFNAYVRYGDTVDKRTGKPTVGFEFRFD